jgi:hypothetical protein
MSERRRVAALEAAAANATTERAADKQTVQRLEGDVAALKAGDELALSAFASGPARGSCWGRSHRKCRCCVCGRLKRSRRGQS